MDDPVETHIQLCYGKYTGTQDNTRRNKPCLLKSCLCEHPNNISTVPGSSDSSVTSGVLTWFDPGTFQPQTTAGGVREMAWIGWHLVKGRQ